MKFGPGERNSWAADRSRREAAFLPVLPFVCRLLLVVVTFLLAPVTLALSQDRGGHPIPTFAVALDRHAAEAGEVVELALRLDLPAGFRFVDGPDIRALEGLTLVGTRTLAHGFRIRLLVDRLDDWKSGPFRVSVVDDLGNKVVLRAPPVSLDVLPTSDGPSAGAELRPIQPILPRETSTTTRAFSLGALLLLVLVAALVFLLRHRRSLSVEPPHRPPPHARALREIDELQAEGLYEAGAVKEFYRRFTGILRRYLQGLKGFPASGCTAEEIAEHLPGEEDGKLAHLLKWADLVKFAGLEPTPERKDEDVKMAVSYIQRTGLARTGDHGPVAPGC
jgi:hypothetical protein